MRRRLLAGLAMLAGIACAAGPDLDALMRDHQPRAVPPLPLPAVHAPFRDPVFGTRITRVTDPSQLPGVKRIRHYYSKSNPFNADDSLAIFFRNDGGASLYDTKAWLPQADLPFRNSDPEAQWHPTDPNVLYFLDLPPEGSTEVRAMYRYDVRAGTRQLLRDFAEYDSARARMEGNMDRAGRHYAMVGSKGRQLEAFVYDVVDDKVVARTPVEEHMVADWISVSPSGKYVVMMGKDRTRVYDIRLRPLHELPRGSIGHGDLCLRADGSEALVYDGADHQINNDRNINVADLATGRVAIGVRIGWKSTPHVACRNLDMPGWALVSTQGPDPKYPNRDFEIFWMKLDGSGAVRRLAHHRSSRAKGGYFAEQHAVSNRRGNLVVFASNWGAEMIAAYLAELPPDPRGKP